VTENQPRSHRRLVIGMVVAALLMFGLGFAIAPLYDSICKYFGISGRVKEATAEKVYNIDTQREITLGFLTVVNGDMPLEFRPAVNRITVHPGQYYTVDFYARNLSDKPLVGQAIPSISPVWAAEHLKKTECFCFTAQPFEPHQERKMPVRFVIEPDVAGDTRDMTLSYTFFDITNKK
jgi:cytochrome c oxidase assembly protein subunit 11